MSICFNPNNQQFLLHTDHTSYVMELYNGRLSHVYWGSRISHAPVLEQLFPFRFGADFSATDLPGRIINSTDKLPQEYPVFGSADMRSPAFHGMHPDGNSISCFLYDSHRICSGKPSFAPERIRLQGLDADANYECNGTVFSGSSLMNIGLSVDTRHDLDSKIYILKKSLPNNK